MKFIKRIVRVGILLIVLSISFRGFIYRKLVAYKSIGQSTSYTITNEKLINSIDSAFAEFPDLSIDELVRLSLSITANKLSYSADKNDVDPNQLINSKTAHCVGYASFFASTCNYLLAKYGLADEWLAKPQIGQLYILNVNVHPYFSSSFFKDHDFVLIENRVTGEKIAVDPTIHDYLWIDFITIND